MNQREMERLYAEAVGKEKLERQLKMAESTCAACGGRDGRHHQLCRAKSRLKEAA